jgi:hypothetical protein
VFEKLRLKRKGKSGQGIVTSAQKRGGERGPEGSRTTVHYDVTVKMRFEDGGEFENSQSTGNFFVGTSLSFGPGDIVPTLFDPNDHSKFIIDEKKMVAEQKEFLDRKKRGRKNRELDPIERERVAEAEDGLPPTPS